MSLTPAEYFTHQFYTWESRGRGWFLAKDPIHLEPPFIPFFRHLPQPIYIDDGKRHTLVSWFIESIKGKKKSKDEETEVFDYETIEPYIYNEETDLSALQIKLPKERTVTPENMKALLTMLSSIEAPVSFEIIGNVKEIIIQVVSRTADTITTETQIKAYFPEFFVIRDDTYLDIFIQDIPVNLNDFGLREEFVRPIATAKNFSIDPLTGLLGVFENLSDKQHGGVQILFTSAVNSWSNSITRSVTLSDGKSFFADDPESPKLAIEKTRSPIFGVAIRAFGQGKNQNEAEEVLIRISQALLTASVSPYNALIPLPHIEYDAQTRIDDIYLRESHRLGMLLNVDELVNLLHFPSEQIQSKKLSGSSRKTKALPVIAKAKEFILGTNTHNGITENATTGITERLKHTHVIGATGTGKSTLLLSMVVQDIEQGNGVAVLDPHGDLIETILSYISEKRLKDVVILDPSDSEYPVAFNILHAHSDIEKEILSSDLVAAFKRLSTSWGDQMHSVFSNAVLAFLESSKGGTLAELRRFLIEPTFRSDFLKSVNDPNIHYYWQKEYPLLKTNSIGPILTRLDTFLRPRLIRNMVGQHKGLDFENILDTQKILLVKLSQGLIGNENSYLLGTFVVSKIHQAALARQVKSERKDFFLYIDEFQHFITPSMASILSGARKYRLGLVLAHQDMQQLIKNDTELASSVIANAGTRICFRVGEIDAKRLADGFSFFEAQDLQNLDTGEAIARIERPEYDFSLTTAVLQESTQPKELKEKIIDYSREHYSTSREVVEKILAESLQIQYRERPEQPSVKTEIEQKKTEHLSKELQPIQSKEVGIENKTLLDENEAKQIIEKVEKRKQESQHRYLQTLIKKMAESRGYKATLEAPTPDNTGKIDVLLEKENMQIACEVSVTTDANWEIHNIQKCLTAGYALIVSCTTDKKAINTIQKKIQGTFSEIEQQKIKVFEPDALFTYLDTITTTSLPMEAETIMKGYRVKVSYDDLSEEEQKHKKDSVARVVWESLRKMKK